MKKKKLCVLIITALLLILSLGACNGEVDDLSGLNLEDIDIDAIDAFDVPTGTYTISYTIEDLNKYIEQYGISVAVSVVDDNDNAIDISGNSFEVQEGVVYTATISIIQNDTVVKSKVITITAISLQEKLAAPSALSIYQNYFITFNAVEYAQSYTISINGDIFNVTSALYDIKSLYDDPDEYTIKVKAQADGYLDSDYSTELTVSTVIESIALDSSPAISYVEGDSLDYDNIIVRATYEDKRTAIISTTGCLISIIGRTLTPNDETVQIIHVASGKTLSFDITVIPLSEAVWTVTFNGNGGNRVGGGLETQDINHDNAASAPEYTWKDHLFLGFDKDFDSVKSNLTVNAQWLDLTIGSAGLDYEVSYDYSFYTVTGYWGTGENVVIPSVYNSLPVLRIGNQAFFNNNNAKRVYIPQSVNSLGVDVFSGCNNLQSIHVSEANEYFEAIDGVLYDKSINMLIRCPIGKSGIMTIPDGVQSIGYEGFAGCANLTQIIIPDSVYDIADRAFFNTTWYNNQADGIVYAGKVAYKYKGTMPQNAIIELAADTLGIAGGAFELQDNLSEIILTNGYLKVIGNYAFSGCDSLNFVLISDTIMKIGAGAFKDCNSLANIYIPDTLDNIGVDAFKNTLWYNNQPDGVVYAGKVAIGVKGEMPKSVILQDGTLAIGDGVFSLYDGNNVLENIHIPDTVVRIGSTAFNGCRALTRVYLPLSVAYIGSFAFNYTQLEIYVEADKAQAGWDRLWNPDPRPVIYNAINQAVTYTFVTNGGSDVEPITAPFLTVLPYSEKEGYTLGDWYDNAELSGEPVCLPYYSKNGGTLYAEWIIKTYFVQFFLPSGWTRTGGGNLIQLIAHGSDAAAPIVSSGDDTFVAWYKDYTNVKENLEIVPVRAKLFISNDDWARYTMLYAEVVGADLEIDYEDGKGYTPYVRGMYKNIYSNCTIKARASFNAGDYVYLPDFIIDNIDSSRPTTPYIDYWHNDDDENIIELRLYGGKANGASSVTHHYRLNGGDWIIFTEDIKDIVANNNVFIEFKTVNEAETPSSVVRKTISITKQIYEDNLGYPIERYIVNEYEILPSGESIKITGLKGGYDEVNQRYNEFNEYPIGDSYEGCGVKAAQIFVRWFGKSMSQSYIKDDYVETTNVGWLDSWIFTTPAQLEDGVQDILDENDYNYQLSRRSIDSTAGAVTWIQNQLAAGFPVIILANDGDHWQVITEAVVIRDNNGDIVHAMFLTHDNGGKEWRTWGEIDYFFEDNWSAEVARFLGYTSYRDTMISVLIE